MIRSKGAPKTGNVAIVDIMGGAGIYGIAWAHQVEQCNKSLSLGNDVVYFLPSYRRPPEIKQPEAFKDVHNFISHLYNNSEAYGIDKSKIGVYGVSGGGYIQSGVGMLLAQND